MVSFTSAIVVMIAAIGLIQMCPAPVSVAARIANSQALTNAMFEPGDAPYLPPGVPRPALDKCRKEVADQKAQNRPVKMRNVEGVNDTVLVDNVPTACMNLATVLSSQPNQQGPAVIPQGDHSLQYNGIKSEERKKLAKIFST